MSISVRGLRFRNGDFILEVDSLDFTAGRTTAIVGPNGAGKTTLLKCLAGINNVERKRIFVQRTDLEGLKGQERARLISYVPQEHSSVFNYSVQDFVLLGRAAYLPLFSLPAGEDVRAAEEALAFVGLRKDSDRPYFELSSGERRLVLIARALAQNADILLLDEPTTFLDARHERDILELIGRLAREKKKTLLVTIHDLDMAVRYADIMVFMKDGKIHTVGRPEEILSEPLLEDVYGVKMKVMTLNGRKHVIR